MSHRWGHANRSWERGQLHMLSPCILALSFICSFTVSFFIFSSTPTYLCFTLTLQNECSQMFFPNSLPTTIFTILLSGGEMLIYFFVNITWCDTVVWWIAASPHSERFPGSNPGWGFSGWSLHVLVIGCLSRLSLCGLGMDGIGDWRPVQGTPPIPQW